MVIRQQQIPRQHELTFKNKQVIVDTLSSSERVIIEEEKESDLSQSLDSIKQGSTAAAEHRYTQSQ